MDDIVHGGAIASLIDTAGMAATWSDDSEPESLAGSTVTLNVNYVVGRARAGPDRDRCGRQARAEHGVQRGPGDRAGRARRRHRLGRPAAGVMTEARGSCERLAARELSALPRGIGDIHRAISGRVFGALGPSAAPVRRDPRHDRERRLRGRQRRAALDGARAGSRQDGSCSRDAARCDGAGRAERAARRQARRSRWRSRWPCVASASPPRRDSRSSCTASARPSTRGARASYGERLHEDLGITPVFVRFNTGRHISENGASLAALLDELVASWPVDVEQIALIGHSMGGLVARSACHHGGDWTVARAPHGLARHAALGRAARAGRPRDERGAGPRARDAPVRALPAPPQRRHPRPAPRLARRRGLARPGPRRAALQGARRGPAARGRHPLLRRRHRHPQPERTRSAACSATRSCCPPSASGRRVGFAADDGLELGGTHHLALLNHPEVDEQLKRWLDA